MNFGEFFKAKRIANEMTLREFCEKYEFDPGNISKLERGVLPAPLGEDKLKKYAKALGVKPGSDDYVEFFDLAAASAKNFSVKNIKDEELLRKLPVLFRTLDKKDLTEEKLNRIIRLIREEGIG